MSVTLHLSSLTILLAPGPTHQFAKTAALMGVAAVSPPDQDRASFVPATRANRRLAEKAEGLQPIIASRQ
ncbi:hypothetical protein EI94DRAFT_1738317 [Lactarius quietus]|nr:hypothetical protein EI94DRAFT_1738317 [Lactarius quietus]